VIFVQTPPTNFHVSTNAGAKPLNPPKRITYPSAASYAIDARNRGDGPMGVQEPPRNLQVSPITTVVVEYPPEIMT
jgi:hypothetical protein